MFDDGIKISISLVVRNKDNALFMKYSRWMFLLFFQSNFVGETLFNINRVIVLIQMNKFYLNLQ